MHQFEVTYYMLIYLGWLIDNVKDLIINIIDGRINDKKFIMYKIIF
jgi:hypothetical protein